MGGARDEVSLSGDRRSEDDACIAFLAGDSDPQLLGNIDQWQRVDPPMIERDNLTSSSNRRIELSLS